MTPGDLIAGKYSLIRPVGKGSMGEVWAALHVEMRRPVALKLIYEGSEDLALRLKREALACGRLEHPNIVRIYDIGETTAGDPFLVMELLQGETLAERQARAPRLTPVEALEVTLQIARALRAAHGAGVVHRDLKPANVYLHRGPDAETEQVKVLDFGVSKVLSLGTDTAYTVTGALVGSPAYMSPEAARALKNIDPRADLWSLGVLLFEMLTGSRPFAGVTIFGVVAEILTGPIPTLASALPGVDPRLDEVMGRCLTRDLQHRLTAAGLVDALTPLLASARATGSVMAPRAAPPAPALDGKVTAPLRSSPPRAQPVLDEEDEATRAWRAPAPEPEGDKTTAEMTGERALAFRRELAARVAARSQSGDTMPVPVPLAAAWPAPAPAAPQPHWGANVAAAAPMPPPRAPQLSVVDPGRLTLPPDWDQRPQVSYVPLIGALSVVALVLAGLIAFTLINEDSDAPPAAPSAAGGQAR